MTYIKRFIIASFQRILEMDKSILILGPLSISEMQEPPELEELLYYGSLPEVYLKKERFLKLLYTAVLRAGNSS